LIDKPPEKPLATVTPTEIKIEESVKFETDSATLLASSDVILTEVKRVLEEHPEIKKLRVEGHTDNVGDDQYHFDLSTRRATSVVAWLVDHGVSSDRLTSQGFGSKQPIDTNETEAGRANNRRVVFKIVERTTTSK
jgi:OOP family OmpA-OmpF porin